MDHKEPHQSSTFSILESIALEIESLFREIRAVWMGLPISEKFASASAAAMFFSCFLPWFSAPMNHTQSGIDGFGTVHFGISAAVVLLVRKVALERFRLRWSQNKLDCFDGRLISSSRLGLWLLCLGALSTATCIALLLHFGDLASSQEQINVRYGFYMVLFSGIGISAGGLSKFA